MFDSSPRSLAALPAALVVCTSLLLLPGARPVLASGPPRMDANTDAVWTLVGVPGSPPPVGQVASAFDPVRRQLIVFGGMTSNLDPTATLSTIAASGPVLWFPPVPGATAPVKRIGATLVYDSARDGMLLFGGKTDSGVDLDLWELSLGGTPTWSPTSADPSGPSRTRHSAIYDPVRDRMLVFGGEDASGVLSNQLWAYNLSGTTGWTLLSPGGTLPFPREGASAIYDPVGDRMIVFGGLAKQTPTITSPANDTWALSLSGAPTWTKLTTAGIPPSPCESHGAVYQSTQGRMVVYGGDNGSGLDVGQAYALTLGPTPTWSNITPLNAFPPPRNSFAYGYDPVADRVIIAGGRHPSTIVLDDAWTLDLSGTPTFTVLKSLPPSPGNRLLHMACYDSKRRVMDVFGGSDNVNFYNTLEGASLNTPVPVFTLIDSATSLRPNPRTLGALVYDSVDDQVVLFGGGTDASHLLQDTWEFHLNTGQWTKVVIPGPSARYGVSSAYDATHNRMLIFGGWDGAQRLNDVWALTLGASPHWDLLATTGPAPEGRYTTSMVYDPVHDRIAVACGQGVLPLLDVWTLDLSGPLAWTQQFPAGSGPVLRYAMLTVFDSARDRMVVFGGWSGHANNDSYALLLSQPTVSWLPINPPDPLPYVRDFSAGVYDPVGDRMVMYGGSAITPASSNQLVAIGDVWTLAFTDQPTPTFLTFADEQVGAGTVRLTWYTPDGAGQAATAYRSADGASWQSIASLASDAAGEFVLTDAVPAGGRFDYRLGIVGAGGEQFTSDHWSTIPADIAFGITSTGANPSRGALPIAFAVVAGGSASLDLYDVAGRRVAHRDVSGLGAGAHTLDLAGDRALGSGVYWVRLSQGERVAQRRIALVR